MPVIVVLNLKDVTNPTSEELDAQCYKRGDFIDIVTDTHGFSAHELSVPHWRMVKLMNVDYATAEHILDDGPEVGVGFLRQRRKYMFKFDSPLITPAFQAFLDDNTRATPIYETALQLAQLLEIRVERPARAKA